MLIFGILTSSDLMWPQDSFFWKVDVKNVILILFTLFRKSSKFDQFLGFLTSSDLM